MGREENLGTNEGGKGKLVGGEVKEWEEREEEGGVVGKERGERREKRKKIKNKKIIK